MRNAAVVRALNELWNSGLTRVRIDWDVNAARKAVGLD
jgi:hypothetical protein